MHAVGVPIRFPDDSVFGAVSMSAPASRRSGERFRSVVPELVMGIANLIEVTLETAQCDGCPASTSSQKLQREYTAVELP